jgi:predicted TIM-barrel fold metal-dependent hydrolase
MVVDVHTHIFACLAGRVGAGPVTGLSFGRARIGDQFTQLLPPLAETLAFPSAALIAHLDWAGVSRAVLLQGPFYGECNAYVAAAVRRYPERLLAAACIDPWGQSREQIEALLAAPEFRAAKIEFSVPSGLCGLYPQARLDAPDLAWLWRGLAAHGQRLVLDLGTAGTAAYQTDAVRQIAQAHPDLRVIIAHLGQPRPQVFATAALRRAWEEQIDLGCLPNVWFDSAALPAYLPQETVPFATAGEYLHRVCDRIGAARIMWGSDIPGLLTWATYPQLVQLARAHSGFMTAAEQAGFLGGTALQVWG